MNRALRHSQIIDMDLDGIANGNDDLPLQPGVSALTISSIDLSQVDGKVAVNFTAFQGTYQVQYTDSLENPVWKTAGNYTIHFRAQTKGKFRGKDTPITVFSSPIRISIK